MKIAIVGVGAVGGSIASLLAHDHEVMLVPRTPIAELVVNGERVAHGAFAHADWVLVCTKAYDVPSLARFEGARVAVLQNGVEHEVRFPGALPVVVACPSERSAPGVVRLRGDVTLTVRDDDDGRAFAALAPFIAVTRDFTTALWRKLCVNVAGAVTALHDAPLDVMRREEVAVHARALIAECAHVGVAEGARLADPEEHARALVAELQRGDPDAVPSILQDLRAGRPLEVDARNGAVVRFGARHGIPTPANSAVVAALSRP